MILTDYYKFEKLQGQQSGTRVDCTSSTKSYQPLESRRATKAMNRTAKRFGCVVGDLFLHFGANNHTKAGRERKVDLSLSKESHITSIYTPDIENLYFFGDMVNTSDAIVGVFTDLEIINGKTVEGSVIEIFIARGQLANKNQLYNKLVDGELDEDMALLRARATDEAITHRLGTHV